MKHIKGTKNKMQIISDVFRKYIFTFYCFCIYAMHIYIS